MSIDLTKRQSRIGGSEVGTIFNVDEYRSRYALWLEKMGWLQRPPPTLRMIIGKLQEPTILALYTYLTGRVVERSDETVCDPVRPYMVHTIDGWCVREPRLLELKTVFFDQFAKWGPTEDRIPPSAVLQCRYYLAAKYPEYEACDLCVLKGDKLEIHTIQHDPEIARVILARVEEWWRRYLVEGEEPEIDDSTAATAWLQQAFPRHKRPDLRAATEEEIALLTEYIDVRRDAHELNGRRTKLENQLKRAIAEQEGLEWPGGRFTWRRTRDSETTDWHSMAVALYTNFIKDPGERAELLTRYTSREAGYRRIHLALAKETTDAGTENDQ